MKKIYLALLTLLLTGITYAQDVTFTAEAPQTVIQGEQFALKYILSGEGSDLRIPPLPEFEILMGPSVSKSTNISIINGKTERQYSVTYTYILLPQKEGTYTIPSATVKIKGANYTSNELKIKVLPPDTKANTQNNATSAIDDKGIFVRLILSKTNVYEQEGILATLKLYTVYNAGLESINFPEFEGFLVQEIEQPQNQQWSMENYNGRNYKTVILKQAILYPQHSGEITIGSGRYDAIVQVRNQQNIRSFFDDFFDTFQQIRKVIISAPVTVKVKPLPSGKPATFAGAVGNFTMTTTISSKTVKANEAVTIKVDITGQGNMKLLKVPEVQFPNDFEIYDPKIENNIKTTEAGVSGTKKIEYYAIPRYPGEFEIPPVEFSYFDLKTNTYKTLKSEPFHITVEKGENTGNPVVMNNYANKEEVKILGNDIRYLKTKNITYQKQGNHFFGTPIYWATYLILTLLAATLITLFRKQAKENSNFALQRTKKANKVATKRLKIAQQMLKNHKNEEFYEELHKALWGYISDKLNIPFADLTKDNIEQELRNFGVEEQLINEFINILNTCEFARFAPTAGKEGKTELYEKASQAISKMENTIKR